MSTVEFYGETFQINHSVSADALTDFADAAVQIQSASSDMATQMGTIVTVRALVFDCIAPADLARFKATSRANRAGIDDWMAVVKATVEQESERPTGRPSDSSDGPGVTEPKSGSSAGDNLALLLPGRPDKQLGILRQLAG